MLEKTLVILKPCTLQRGLVGEITHRFERKGLRLAGMKMMQLTDELLNNTFTKKILPKIVFSYEMARKLLTIFLKLRTKRKRNQVVKLL